MRDIFGENYTEKKKISEPEEQVKLDDDIDLPKEVVECKYGNPNFIWNDNVQMDQTQNSRKYQFDQLSKDKERQQKQLEITNQVEMMEMAKKKKERLGPSWHVDTQELRRTLELFSMGGMVTVEDLKVVLKYLGYEMDELALEKMVKKCGDMVNIPGTAEEQDQNVDISMFVSKFARRMMGQASQEQLLEAFKAQD